MHIHKACHNRILPGPAQFWTILSGVIVGSGVPFLTKSPLLPSGALTWPQLCHFLGGFKETHLLQCLLRQSSGIQIGQKTWISFLCFQPKENVTRKKGWRKASSFSFNFELPELIELGAHVLSLINTVLYWQCSGESGFCPPQAQPRLPFLNFQGCFYF